MGAPPGVVLWKGNRVDQAGAGNALAPSAVGKTRFRLISRKILRIISRKACAVALRWILDTRAKTSEKI